MLRVKIDIENNRNLDFRPKNRSKSIDFLISIIEQHYLSGSFFLTVCSSVVITFVFCVYFHCVYTV